MQDHRVLYYLSWLNDSLFGTSLDSSLESDEPVEQCFVKSTSDYFDIEPPCTRSEKFSSQKSPMRSRKGKMFHRKKSQKSKKVFTKAVSSVRSDKYFVDPESFDSFDDDEFLDEIWEELDEFGYPLNCSCEQCEYCLDDDEDRFDWMEWMEWWSDF